jgi:uncharacterized membrane protein
VSQPYNPYAPPQAAVARPAGSTQPGQPQPWQIGEVLAFAWERFKDNWLVLTGAHLLYLLLTQAVTRGIIMIAVVLSWRASDAMVGAMFAGVLGSMVLGTFLLAGFQRICLEVARGGTPSLGVLFSGGDRFLPLLGAILLVAVLFMLGTVLLIVPGIIVALGLCLAQYYVIDANMGPVQALKASWAATQGHKGDLLLLGLTVIAIAVLGMLAFCVGYLAAMPFGYLALAIVYTRLSGTAPAGAAAGDAS